jgi:hypothetical protein
LKYLRLLCIALVLGCRDELTAPADCPALCPGGQPPVQETVVPAIVNQDSSFSGYVAPGVGISLRVSNGLPVSEDRALVLFLPRGDSITVKDTARTYTIDSVAITLTLQARDTTVGSLRFLVYRIPVTIDTTTTFADVAGNFIDANIIDTIVVPDTQKTGQVADTLSGAELARVLIPAADSGLLAIGIALEAASPTGARLASIAASGSPSFKTFATVNGVSDTTLNRQVLTRFPRFTGWVSQNPQPLDNTLLEIGGGPSARARIRFALPPAIRDSVTILRATLELTTNAPILGLPNDPGVLQAIGVVGDLGAKSPLISGSSVGVAEVADGTTGVVEIDVTRMVRAWQTKDGFPPVLFVAVAPEASSFTEPVFRSTRSGSGAPQLRITYFDKFPFQRP